MTSKFEINEIDKKFIPKGWYETTLGKLVTFQRGHDLTLKNIVKGSYPIVSSSGILGYHNE